MANPLPAFFGGAKVISSGLDFAQNHFLPVPPAYGFPLAAVSNLGNKLYNHLSSGSASGTETTLSNLPYISSAAYNSRSKRFSNKRYKRRRRKTYRLRNGKTTKKNVQKAKKAISSRF